MTCKLITEIIKMIEEIEKFSAENGIMLGQYRKSAVQEEKKLGDGKNKSRVWVSLPLSPYHHPLMLPERSRVYTPENGSQVETKQRGCKNKIGIDTKWVEYPLSLFLHILNFNGLYDLNGFFQEGEIK
ncbi:MAG: hypothetical protein FK732_00780 [Asgard group archaeon]|nr:hypothetical protein [Asgard group archaeon]